MAQIGDTVRYLSATGGGKITRIEGKMAWVAEDNGFEMPVALNELVVVLPAGSKTSGPRLTFDQAAYDKGKATESDQSKTGRSAMSKDITPPAAPQPAAPETRYGDRLNIALAFEPLKIRELGSTSFNAVLVNDSNYTLLFSFLRAGEGERQWQVVYSGTAQPNELIDLAQPDHEELNGYYRVALQYVAFKPDRPFDIKAPMSVARRLDLTKFYKLHCFRPGDYFTSPVLELKLVENDEPIQPLQLSDAAQRVDVSATPADQRMVRELSDKYRVGRDKKRPRVADNPNKLLPPIEIDLHIHALTDSIAGLENSDMLAMQLDAVEAAMKANIRRIGQKIIFIHGKGNGVLRRAVHDLLHRRYPSAELQDASFAEYGFGATLVTIHHQTPKP